MKKKTILFIFSTLVILIGILIFSGKISFIKNIENIKSKKIEEKEITKIDVTDLENNGNLDHEHLFKTMYDENKHWEECTVCGQKNNELDHSYTDNGWLYGSSCKEENVHKYSCKCGYSYSTKEGKPSHKLSENWNVVVRFSLEKQCLNYCGYSQTIHKCKKNDGSLINCGNLGRCVMCGYNYTTSNVQHYVYAPIYLSDNSEINERDFYCRICSVLVGRVNYSRIVRISTNEYLYQAKVTFPSGYSYYNITDNDMVLGKHNVYKNVTNGGSTCVIERRITFNEYMENGGVLEIDFYGKKNGMTYGLAALAVLDKLDNVAPSISSITMTENEELTEWSRTKPIIVSGIENYCKSVTVKIVDENENVFFEGKASVNNPTDSNYSISCIPQLEVDTNGKNFKAIVADACGNITEREFTISKVDAIPPVAISSDEIIGEWSKSRKFTFKATDRGIGEVSIAFNDVGDLSLAKFNEVEYSRDYEFYGDVYSPKQLSVLYRDKLGNTSIQKVTIDKLDNTAPTITSASVHNNVISIIANDEHEKLGEGSGVVKYRYIASEEKLDSPDVSNGKEINANDKMVIDEIYKVKYVYIEAEDLVGNVSKVYEFKIPELVLTSRVDTSLADGKGGVILDWSTYDVEDKYFVIYRKEEKATKWETIVSLEEKLTGSSYTDILANDKNKSNTPNINISGDAQNNNIKINATSSDNGTKYSYYIEAYDDNKNLLQTSIK